MTSEEKKNILKYKRFTKTATPPYRAYTQSCGLDLTSDEDDVTILPGKSVRISTGLGFEFPIGNFFDNKWLKSLESLTFNNTLLFKELTAVWLQDQAWLC